MLKEDILCKTYKAKNIQYNIYYLDTHDLHLLDTYLIIININYIK